MRLVSTYRDKGNNFEVIVIRETETEYICKHLQEDYKKFQNGEKEFRLRKSIVGENGIYKVKEEDAQISLFDLLEEER